MYTSANAFSREISRHYDNVFRSLNLTTSYVELLLYIHKKKDCTQKELADEMMLAPSTITRFISKLEKRKFVEKNRSGKTVTVKLTDEGEDKIAEIKRLYRKADKELSILLGERFLETTSKLLEFGADQLGNQEE